MFLLNECSLTSCSFDSLEVLIDAHNTGEWVPCVTIADTGLPSNWARSAHIGLTATTGQLADNHDIISLKSFTDLVMLESVEVEEAQKRHFQLDVQQPFEVQLKRCFYFLIFYLLYLTITIRLTVSKLR